MAKDLREYPVRGAFRVHRAPTTRFIRPPRDRFDDPASEYTAWYLASTLRGALIEVLNHFRPDPATEQALADVRDVTDVDIAHGPSTSAGYVPNAFLASLRVAVGRLVPAPGHAFRDVMDEDYLAAMNLDLSIRAVLAFGGHQMFGRPPALNFGSIQAQSSEARMLTQALSRTVFEDPRNLRGIRYVSCHTEAEECWAVFEHESRNDCRMVFSEPARLEPLNPEHRNAVRSAALLLRLQLPDAWSG